jgi:hypothetical protein
MGKSKINRVALFIQDEDCEMVRFPIASYRQALRLLAQHLEKQHQAALIHTPDNAAWFATVLRLTHATLRGKQAFKPLHYITSACQYHINLTPWKDHSEPKNVSA